MRGLLFWRWLFSSPHPFMQRDASKWPMSCSDLRQLAVSRGPVQGFRLLFFIWSLFFLPLAGMKRHKVVRFRIFLHFSSLFFVSYLLICCCGILAEVIELRQRNKHCWALNDKIITYFDLGEKQSTMQTPLCCNINYGFKEERFLRLKI